MQAPRWLWMANFATGQSCKTRLWVAVNSNRDHVPNFIALIGYRRATPPIYCGSDTTIIKMSCASVGVTKFPVLANEKQTACVNYSLLPSGTAPFRRIVMSFREGTELGLDFQP